MSHIRLEADLLTAASGCELNLFFHNDVFEAGFTMMEPLLIL